jgi:hypothetical protein
MNFNLSGELWPAFWDRVSLDKFDIV